MTNISFPKLTTKTAIHLPEKQDMIDLFKYVAANNLDMDKKVNESFLNGSFWNNYEDETCVAFDPALSEKKYFTTYGSFEDYIEEKTPIIEYEDLFIQKSESKKPFIKTITMSDVYKEVL